MPSTHDRFDALQGPGRIGWVITGGETDQGAHRARPWHPQWVRSLRDQCAASGTPFHHKQNGELCSYDLIGANGWTFTREIDGTRFGRLSVGGVGSDEVPLFDRAEFETVYPFPRPHDPGPCIVRVGKKRSGRLLDGVEHNARPYVRPLASAA